jgi:hypothetical protein
VVQSPVAHLQVVQLRPVLAPHLLLQAHPQLLMTMGAVLMRTWRRCPQVRWVSQRGDIAVCSVERGQCLH